MNDSERSGAESAIYEEILAGRAHNLGKTSVKISYRLGDERRDHWLKRSAAILADAELDRQAAEDLKLAATARMAAYKQKVAQSASMATFLSAGVVEGQWELSGELWGSIRSNGQWISDGFGPVPESLMPLEPYRADAIRNLLRKEGQLGLFDASVPSDGDAGGGAVIDTKGPGGDDIPFGDDGETTVQDMGGIDNEF